MQYWIRLYAIILFFALLFVSQSCTTGQRVSTIGDRQYQDVFGEANRYFQLEQYKRAILKYNAYVYSPYPDKKHLEKAKYRLALSHMMLQQPHEAYTTAKHFLEDYPSSPWADEAQELMAQAKSSIESKQQQMKQQEQELISEITQLEKTIQQKKSTESEVYMDLADKYWKAGQIQKSIEAYEKAADVNPEHFKDSDLRNRVRITEKGEFTVRDPMLDFEKEDTVQIVNAELQQVRRDDWLGEYVALRYSGEVRNTGLYDVTNVQLEVAVYDLYERLQDTRIVAIGTIPAGGQRPFAVILNRYSGMAIDVTKVETQIYYDQR